MNVIILFWDITVKFAWPLLKLKLFNQLGVLVCALYLAVLLQIN